MLGLKKVIGLSKNLATKYVPNIRNTKPNYSELYKVNKKVLSKLIKHMSKHSRSVKGNKQTFLLKHPATTYL